jgi:hypothetical protein
MELHEARENIIDRLIEDSLLGPDNYWVLLAADEDPGMKAVFLAALAGELLLWEEAELISGDPSIQDTPFAETPDGNLRQLGIQAAHLGDIEQARKFFGKMEEPTYDGQVHIVDGLLKHGRIEEAEAIIRREADFSVIKNGGMQTRLGFLVRVLCALEGGPSRALSLVQELVPCPETSAIVDKAIERSRMDYFVESIPAAALLQGDQKTAEEAISIAYDMIGAPAAMGGGGILDEAYRTESPSVISAVKELIRQKSSFRQDSDARP